MFDWLKNANQNLVTVATALIALVLTVLVARYAMIPYYAAQREKRILDTRIWDGILDGLRTDRAARYFAAIEASVGWFERTYGPKLFGYRAFDRALLFAFLYAAFTLLIGWAVFDAGQLGGVAFMPEGLPFWRRMVSLSILLAVGALTFCAFKFETQIKTAIGAGLAAPLSRATLGTGALARLKRVTLRNAPEALYTLILIGAVAGVGVVATAGVVADVGSVASVASFAVAGAATASAAAFGAAVGAGAFAIAIAAIVAVALVLAPTFTPEFPYLQLGFGNLSGDQASNLTTLCLFLVILPLLNACADFLSIAATRQFLRRIVVHRKTAVQVLVGVGIDLFIAAACLALLLGSIIATLDLWRDFAPVTLPFDWRAYRDTLCAGDWQRGTMLWLMLSTTLAPTALHLAAGFGAIFAHSATVDNRIAAILRPARDALVTKYKAKAFDTGHEARAKAVLTADQRQRLEDLLGQKEGAQRWLSVTLFIVFMVLMMVAVLAVVHRFAPPLCPGA